MTPEQQHEAFVPAPDGFRKVVLSTNIAEASVTINDIVYVIDAGVRKERSFDPNTAVSSLDTKMVTRANAIQRRGRAGRCQEGMVIHLFPSYKFQTFDEFPMPQMLTSSMEEVVLQSKVIHGGSNTEISSMLTTSMAAPKPEALTHAVDSLKGMSCLTQSGALTVLGRAVAAIPVDPKVAKFLLIAGAFRCIKPAACIAAFLSIKSPFQQTAGSELNEKSDNKKVTGKEYFNKQYHSDHLMNVQAYVEWRRESAKGKGDDFCDLQGLSPETLDMGYMMVQQFVQFMVDAGYNGADIGDGTDLAEVHSVKKASDEDALVRAAMVAGFSPCLACLYKGQRSPYWYVGNDEVSPFRGSANADYQMGCQDGDEWMIFSDSMKMGRYNSIMDSSLVYSPFVLLFANAVLINEQKGEIRFDKWGAYIEKGPWIKELLDLRSKIMPAFLKSIEERDLSVFPEELTDRIAKFCRQTPIKLKGVEATAKSIEFEATGAQRKSLSIFDWPEDTGDDEEEDGR
jgi:ATP-dependent RNA helicase DHX36